MPALIASAIVWFVIIGISKILIPLLWTVGIVCLLVFLKFIFELLAPLFGKAKLVANARPLFSQPSEALRRLSMPTINVTPNRSISSSIPTKALVIREPWISMILRGEKTWEMRSTAVSIRGSIALIRSGSGQIVGIANLVGCQGPLSDDEISIYEPFHRVPASEIRNWKYAWKLEHCRALPMPVSYRHPKGAVKWVTLDEVTRDELSRQL